MPLMVGDWLKGTRGMRAEVRGVYINLLLFQWDNGFIPASMDDLAFIDPEVGKVWVSIKDKFIEFESGKLRNEKCEEVRSFFLKQAKNGSKGGRPKNGNPKRNPEANPNNNPKRNLHNELELDIESDLNNKKEYDFSKPDISGDEIVFPIDTKPVRDLWAKWKEYRWGEHEVRYGMMGEQADLKRLERMTFEQLQSTILSAISNKWKNLYPEKNGTGKRTNGTKQEQLTGTVDYVKQHYSDKLNKQ